MDNQRPDYSIFTKVNKWTLDDAISIVSREFEHNNMGKLSNDELEEALAEFAFQLEDNADKYSDEPKYKWMPDVDGYPMSDPITGDPAEYVDHNKTEIDIKRFIKFAVWEKLPFPQELVDAFMKKDDPIQNKSAPQKIGDGVISDIMGFADKKYPDFKGIELNALTIEQFTDLKTKYGLLRDAESKYRRALPIATKIGLLFYERSLDKPTTRPAFLEAYKQEFDTILKNDSLAKEIYSYLPEEYRGGSKAPDSSVDLLPIIRAAVYAGSIYDTDDVKVLKKLKAELTENEYELPSDEVLSKIIEAVKEV